jgi:hypothetical protein
MDLTQAYPRSVHEKLHGVVQLARAIDKGKATANGNVGEYHYDCPMDKAVFEFLGIDAAKLLDVIKSAKNDAEIEAYVAPFIDAKSAAELETWNRQWVTTAPTGDSLKYFLELRDQVAPDRKDVTAWADLLDLDEKRPVPERVAA